MATKITATELAKHSTPENCWMVVNNEVYDLTNFAPRHPGGAEGEISYPLRTRMAM
jgi:L-lactate dehydrogenase (cytochrome)